MTDRNYVFSIIISVHNKARYIEETFRSLLQQTFSFEKIQVIFIDDGSTDNSGKICKKIQREHPDNVIYLYQRNKGSWTARNLGMKHATGNYINFLNSDDLISENALSEIYNFFAIHGDVVDFVTLPIYYFGEVEKIHPRYKKLSNENKVIDLRKEPSKFVMSASASFYKKDAITDILFNEDIFNKGEVEFNFNCYKKNIKYGYVCEKQVKYFYRKEFECKSEIQASDKINFFVSPLIYFERIFCNKTKLKPYESELVILETINKLLEMRENDFSCSEEKSKVVEGYSRWLSIVGMNFISQESEYVDTIEAKKVLLEMINISLDDALKIGLHNPSYHKVRVCNAKYSGDVLVVNVLFQTYGMDVELLLAGENGEIHSSRNYDINTSFDIMFGNIKVDETHYRQFSVPIKDKGRYRFVLRHKSSPNKYYIEKLEISNNPPLVRKGENFGLNRKNCLIYFKEESLYISNPKNSLFRNLKISKMWVAKKKRIPKLRFLSRMKKKFILVEDRPKKAGDNGQALFEYIMKNNPRGIKKVTYFVLDKKSPEYEKIKKFGHVISPGSFMHKYLFLNSKAIFSSHNARVFYNPFEKNLYKYSDLLDYKFIWLQHGIAMSDLSSDANMLVTNDDFVVVSNTREREEFCKKKYIYEKSQILLTGLCRFQKLKSDTKKIITFAPTWINYLSGAILPSGYHQENSDFVNSEYYNAIFNLLSSTKLQNLLCEFKYSLQLVLHPGAACYEKYFKKLEKDNISILAQRQANYNDIYRYSSIFITDYSSAAVDFAYLRKPVIYYQFDEKDYFKEHSKAGYFNYRRDGFGPVCINQDDILKVIEELLKKGCSVDEIYLKRSEEFFDIDYKNSCRNLIESVFSYL